MANKYNRILLKLSGESLMGEKEFGIAQPMLDHYAQEIKKIVNEGIEIAIQSRFIFSCYVHLLLIQLTILFDLLSFCRYFILFTGIFNTHNRL
jgi:hypothetical protein